ncbi:hypothetical protein C7M84_009515 [Penaeus vannamei]|uniref:Reverse transcriptase domain-containing protein n=1 Tax=Penaeus vannamei TaxID=6689 RepID=A0A3R7MBD2_PENVA|nr:hypothetical protein C7M84_009515 [Penaeus vannamei]
MKNGKAVGPDNLPVEVWKSLGIIGIEYLKQELNKIMEEEKIPDEWRKSTLIPIFKNKGDIMECGNYRGIKLMSHSMKLYERVQESQLRNIVGISEEQFGFMKGKSTTDAILVLRQLQDKFREGQQELHSVLIDLEKAYDRVPREELYWCMRDKGVPEKYIRVVKDMYECCVTEVKCAVGTTQSFPIQVGLHQGSALSPFLFAIIMDSLTKDCRRKAPWNMMFADDVVLCAREKRELEEDLEQWRYALERRGMKISKSKTEYMCLNGTSTGSVEMLQRQLPETMAFKYLGSTLETDGGVGAEVNRRIQCGWNNWKKMSGILCDESIPSKVKGRIHMLVIQPAMLFVQESPTKVVWSCEKKRRGVCWAQSARDGTTSKKTKRKAEIEMDGLPEKRPGRDGSNRGRRTGPGNLEEEDSCSDPVM